MAINKECENLVGKQVSSFVGVFLFWLTSHIMWASNERTSMQCRRSFLWVYNWRAQNQSGTSPFLWFSRKSRKSVVEIPFDGFPRILLRSYLLGWASSSRKPQQIFHPETYETSIDKMEMWRFGSHMVRSSRNQEFRVIWWEPRPITSVCFYYLNPSTYIRYHNRLWTSPEAVFWWIHLIGQSRSGVFEAADRGSALGSTLSCSVRREER